VQVSHSEKDDTHEALEESGLVRLDTRREDITQLLLRNWNVLLIHCITCYHLARFPHLRWSWH